VSPAALVALLVLLWFAVAFGLWRLAGELERVEGVLASRGRPGAEGDGRGG
jgi:hypothetical protein